MGYIGLARELIALIREEMKTERENASKTEQWVVCSSCGRKFNYADEGGSYEPKTSKYTCSACAEKVEETGPLWTCPHCGAPAHGTTCEYCGSVTESTVQLLNTWSCPTCGRKNTGATCLRCGTRKRIKK